MPSNLFSTYSALPAYKLNAHEIAGLAEEVFYDAETDFLEDDVEQSDVGNYMNRLAASGPAYAATTPSRIASEQKSEGRSIRSLFTEYHVNESDQPKTTVRLT